MQEPSKESSPSGMTRLIQPAHNQAGLSDPATAPSSFHDIEWNVTVNLGIKCNINGVTAKAKVRYYSSPFDNIDTVDGLVDSAKLMASEFCGYMDDVSRWSIKNLYARGEINTKTLNHVDVPDIQFPHFHHGWSNGVMSKEDVEAWIKNEDTDIDRIWPHLRANFTKRQQRLVSLLKSENKILFLRFDTPDNYIRVFNTNQNSHYHEFMSILQKAYPETTIGLLYLYYNTGKYQRTFESNGLFCAEQIPEGSKEEVEQFIMERLSRLKLTPRSKMKPIDFVE